MIKVVDVVRGVKVLIKQKSQSIEKVDKIAVNLDKIETVSDNVSEGII